jgi:hypothetical protein
MKEDETGGACCTYGRYYRIVVGNLEIKRPLGKPLTRWKNNIAMDLQEAGCENLGWIRLVQDRVQWRVWIQIHVSIFTHSFSHEKNIRT